ncbi:MAG: hypothetical protein EOO69_02335 [Moraxellaceae bacterium]|nr:MAG: hypothetical protein EOO69_02335 [Moraxellaceae bacterium]
MLVICPYCHSSHVQLIPPNHAGGAALPFDRNALNSTLSQMTSFAMLGISIARKTTVLPPAIGGLAGAVIGGLFGVIQSEQPTAQASVYQFYCQDCQQSFTRQATH